MAASNHTTSFPPLINPNEPLSYIPSDVARIFHKHQYILVASTGMFAWELLLDIPNMYQLCIQTRVKFPTFLYLLSRVGTLNYCISSLLIAVVGAPNCNALSIYNGVSWTIASPATAGLFFLRVRALYLGNNTVIGFFAFLWLAVVAGGITVPFSIVPASHIIPTSQYCFQHGASPPFASAGFIIPAVFDTLVFLATSYRLFPPYEVTPNISLSARLRLFFSGSGLPYLSKAVLQSGQQYYLVSVVLNLLALVLYLLPAVPLVFHVTSTLPVLCIINAMACRVYRDIKSGRVAAYSTYDTRTNSNLRSVIIAGNHASETTSTEHAPRGHQILVDVIKTTEYNTDLTKLSGRPSASCIELSSASTSYKGMSDTYDKA